MNKFWAFLSISIFLARTAHAQAQAHPQSPFISSWLIGLFLVLALIMFAVFWFMKTQNSPSSSTLPIPQSTTSQLSNEEINSKLRNLPTPKVPGQFYEVSSENKPIPDDKMLLANMKSKIKEVKVHGIPKPHKPDMKIQQAVDEILEQEFKKRAPQFRGEQKENFILPPVSQIPSEPVLPQRPVSSRPPKTKPITNLPFQSSRKKQDSVPKQNDRKKSKSAKKKKQTVSILRKKKAPRKKSISKKKIHKSKSSPRVRKPSKIKKKIHKRR